MRKLLNRLLSKKLKMEYPEDIMTITKENKMYFKGKEVDLKQLAKWKDDIEVLNSLEIYKILKDSMRNDAQALIFKKSNNFDDVLNGKMILWTLEQLDAYVGSILFKYTIMQSIKDREDAMLNKVKDKENNIKKNKYTL
ncbi:MAG: hypothetical protein EOL95_09220 [Bacteroidia bacterium]|nr:hypothetical protein [Bacteroidia bacterium]